MTIPSPTMKPALCVVSINIEGFSQNKSEILSDLCRKTKCDILCVQETHRNEAQSRPHIHGLKLIAEICHPKHGNAVFAAPGVSILSSKCSTQNNIEIITVEIGSCTITSIYKPPGTTFSFDPPENYSNQPIKAVIGDFNSRSPNWGYRDTDVSGQAVEDWAELNDLTLIHNPKQPASFNSGRWKRGYNPDLVFVSSSISYQCIKSVCPPIPRTQHRPIMLSIEPVIKPIDMPFKRRFNYQKAKWDLFAQSIDEALVKVLPLPQNYDTFVEIVSSTSRRFIPRGCRTSYIPGLSTDAADLLKRYESLYHNDPFSEETTSAGEMLLSKIGDNRRDQWITTVSSINMTHNSKKAWSTIRRLTNEPPKPSLPSQVTANQIAHQLIVNGKPANRPEKIPKVNKLNDTCDDVSKPFNIGDIVIAIKQLKCGKASGIDEISVEQIKHLGSVAVSWLLELYNNCLKSAAIPRVWRKSKVIAILKPGKTADDPKNFRPISLLCHTYKLFERLLLNRLTQIIDPKLIAEQAGFRPVKSCCNQTLKLVQHIEDGFERKMVTGAVFVDLSAAYDTVNLKRLLWKVETMTRDSSFVNILRELLHNRRFQVHLLSDKSRWRAQKNGLPQGSVLAPLMFNIYSNDQPASRNTSRFLYADDLALTSQATTFEEVEFNLTHALSNLTDYYIANLLKPNPCKTQSCAFHLRNREANRKLNITWQGKLIEHCDSPKYLGIYLDRSLTFKKNCENIKKKVHTRNSLLRRLVTSKWGASTSVLRTTGLALSFSAGEYACPVWSRSANAKLVNTALNETCRIITGCLKPTPVQLLYPLAGIAPPDVRRAVASSTERSKMEVDTRHPLHNHTPVPQRLKSRKDFIKCIPPLPPESSQIRTSLWKNSSTLPNPFVSPQEELPPGHGLPWLTWKSLNRLRTQVGRSKDNMSRWGYIDTSTLSCRCGITPQTMKHLLSCPSCPYTCTMDDLMQATDNAVLVAEFWADTI